MTTREQFFECECSSGGQHRSAHVRAWTAAEAKRTFLDMLTSDGVDEPGQIVVRPHSPAIRLPGCRTSVPRTM